MTARIHTGKSPRTADTEILEVGSGHRPCYWHDGGGGADDPDKPIKIFHGFAAGGGADLLLRTMLPQLSENLGQQVVIEYRAGAGGNIAMEAVARAAPDGYTLLMGTPGLAINPSLYASLPFDPLKDFAPVSLIGTVQNVLIVNPAVPARTFVS